MATYGQLVQFGPYFNGGLICTLKVYHYIVGTTTLKDVYIDREKGSTAAQPVVSDANGIVSFYADGLYKFRIDGATDGVTYTTLYTYDKWAVGDQSAASGEGTPLVSASTLVLGTDGDFFHVTGSTGPITAISGNQTRVTLVFDSTPTLTYSGSLILAQGLNYTTLANDTFVFVNDGAGVWREVSRNSSTTGLEAQGSPIINGNMDVWQRGTTFATAAATTYTADRWKFDTNGAGVVTIRQSTNVPTVAQAGVLFNYSLEIDVTTADASIGSTDRYAIDQRIEGYNWRHFAQRAIVVSFWVMSSKTGVHSLGAKNTAGDRGYVSEYTVNVANTWEEKIVAIAASPSAGTWDYTTGIGLILTFGLGAGTNETTASLNVWNAFSNQQSTNQVNTMDNTANFFRFTGVKLELGSTATPRQFRSVQDELMLAKRYYQKSFPYGTAPAQNAGTGLGGISVPAVLTTTGALRTHTIFPVTMRTTPTVTTYNPAAANAQAYDENATADCANTAAVPVDSGFVIGWTGNGGSAVGNRMTVYWTASAEL